MTTTEERKCKRCEKKARVEWMTDIFGNIFCCEYCMIRYHEGK